MFVEEVLGTRLASMEKDFVSPTKVSQVSITFEKLYNFYYSHKFDTSALHTAIHSQPAFVGLPDSSVDLGSLGSFFNNLETNVPDASQKK